MNLASWTSRFVCLAALLAASAGARASGLEALLEKVTAAYGGAERLAQTRAFAQYGTTYSSMRGQKGSVLRAYQHPDRLRIEIEYPNSEAELRVLSGARAWRQGRAAQGPFYSSMLLQAARLGLPLTLLDHRRQLKDGGSLVGKRGERLHAVELRFHGNLRLVVGISPETGHIRETRGVMEGDGGSMEFGATYDDFRRIGGRLFAFKEVHYAMGGQTGYTELERVEVAPQLPDELFNDAPPQRRHPAPVAWLRAPDGLLRPHP